ncbi:MAG: hypothetical protein WC346_04320 [Methanogenium sp.]|jgi:seryl-tRNA synthetase
MNKQDALNLWNGLHAVSGLKGAKWAYAVAKNINNLKSEIEALQKSIAPSKEFSEYNNKRLELAQKHAAKEKGVPKKIKIGNTEEYLIADKNKFNKELKPLQKKYKKALDERDKQMKDFEEILKEEVKIDLHMVDSDYIPEEITPAQVTAVMPIINEKEDKT